jgi:Na+/melibiose symporter-like transporter
VDLGGSRGSQATDVAAALRASAARPARRAGWALFDSFRIRSFRFQWVADGLATWASEIDLLVLSWFVLVDTDSPFLVGLLGALRFTGTLLGPLYGIVVDRIDRTKLFVGIRVFMACLAATMMALVLTESLQVWHAFLLATAVGLARQFDMVVRQALLADVVPRESLMNAVGLARSTMDAARITGALAGGQLLARLGLGEAYVAVAALYLVSSLFALGATLGVSKTARTSGGAWQQFTSGIAFMRNDQTITAVMALAFLVNLTAFPLNNGLLPVVARDVYGAGPTGLSILAASIAAGALAGSVGMAAIGRSSRPASLMFAGIVVWHGALIGFGFIPALAIGVPVLALFGASTSMAMITMQTVLMTVTTPEYRGRVMGVRALAVYGLPMGLLIGGWLAESMGVRGSILVLGTAGMALTLAAAARWPFLLRS